MYAYRFTIYYKYYTYNHRKHIKIYYNYSKYIVYDYIYTYSKNIYRKTYTNRVTVYYIDYTTYYTYNYRKHIKRKKNTYRNYKKTYSGSHSYRNLSVWSKPR